MPFLVGCLLYKYLLIFIIKYWLVLHNQITFLRAINTQNMENQTEIRLELIVITALELEVVLKQTPSLSRYSWELSLLVRGSALSLPSSSSLPPRLGSVLGPYLPPLEG